MQSATIWMGGITPEMDSAFVIGAFANMGYTALSVKEVHKKTGERASYCFVDFGDVNVAREVVIKINNQPIPGTKSKFKLNRSEYGRSSGGAVEYSLFVGDLSPEVTDDMLLDFFRAKYPSVRAAKVCYDDRGYPKGYGFVRFYNEKEQEAALKELPGTTGLGDRPLRINKALKSKNPTEVSSDSASKPDMMDPSMIPGFMHMQMQYMQQMQAYMEQCHQYAQQAAQYAGWVPEQTSTTAPQPAAPTAAAANTDGSVLTYIQQQHEQLVSETIALPEDEELVDPNPPVDVVQLNQAIIDLDDKLFFELEVSRWCPELALFKLKEQRPLKQKREVIVID